MYGDFNVLMKYNCVNTNIAHLSVNWCRLVINNARNDIKKKEKTGLRATVKYGFCMSKGKAIPLQAWTGP
jgi:hypothetical protein